MFKKTLSLILAIAMLCALVPFAAIAEEATAELTTTSEELSATLAASTAKTNFNTSALSSVISGTTVKLPATIANYNFSADDYKNFTADANAVAEIKASNTYVLIDSLSTSNFTKVEGTGNVAISRSGHESPWVDGLEPLKSSSGTTPAGRSVDIYVPETKEYQLMYWRYSWAGTGTKDGAVDNSSKFNRLDHALDAWNVGSNAHHYFRMSIDGKPVTYTYGISGEADYKESISNLYKGKSLHDAGLNDATSVADYTQCAWIEWGPTFTLSEGKHTIQVDLMSGSSMPGIILTDKIAFDWSKLFPIMAYGVGITDANFLSANQASMTAIEKVDTSATGPALSGSVEQTDKQDTSVTISLPGINETNALYSVEFNGGEAVYYPATQNSITFDGLAKENTYQVKVTPVDYLYHKGTTQTLYVMTTYPDVPLFTNGSISNVTSLTDADSKLDISWTPAQYFGSGTPQLGYNVYLNNKLKAENLTTTTYSFTNLTAGTEYTVKVVGTLDGVESSEAISCMTQSFYTSKPATATLVSVDDKSATIKISGKFLPLADYEYSNFDISEGNATIDGDVITITGLTPTTKYNVSISFDENRKGEVSTITNNVTVEFNTMNSMPPSPVPEAIYPDYLIEKGVFVQHDFTTAVDQQTQQQINQVATAEAQHKWNAYTADGANTNALWFKSQYWYGSNNSTVEVPLYFPSAGEYYVFAHGSDNGNTSRGVNVSVDGVTVKKGGNTFLFGTTGTSYCDDVVNVTAGNHTITLTQVGGYRLDMVSFVSKAEVDEAGTIADFIAINMSTAEKFEKFVTRHKVEKVFTGDGSGLSIVETSPKVLEVSIFPTPYLNELENVKYNLYLNGALIATLDSDVATYTINTGVVDGENIIKVEAVVGEKVNSYDTAIYEIGAITASAVVVKDANDIISSGVVTLQAPTFMTGTKDVHVLIVAYKNNRMQKIEFTTKTLSATQTDTVPFTVSGDPAKLIDSATANDPAVRSVKMYILDETFNPIELAY